MGNIWYKQCHRTSWLGILIFLNVAKSFRKSPKKIIMAVAMVTVPTDICGETLSTSLQKRKRVNSFLLQLDKDLHKLLID